MSLRLKTSPALASEGLPPRAQPTDVIYDRFVRPNLTAVKARASGDEIVGAMMQALKAARSNVMGKKIGRDNDTILVRSLDKSLEFDIIIFIEHGGMKVIMEGDVGGERKKHKLNDEQKVSDDWIARSTAALFMLAGGEENNVVQIEYYENKI